jgi:N-glycosylase/DNA lyase
MQSLMSQIKSLQKSKVGEIVETRLKEFSSFSRKDGREWFSELCFCILTANSKQKTGAAIQLELGPSGFLTKSQEEIRDCVIKNKHRFHNNKSKYIVKARKFSDIKDIVRKMPEIEARNWIAENIKGIGYKEASHFLRNTGSQNLAILDRHILNLMDESGMIKMPKTLTKKSYFDIEQKFISLAKELKMSPAKLDLFMWYMKTGEVLK